MKFKTRLKVTFLSIIILPLVLIAVSFLVLGMYISRVEPGQNRQLIDYNASGGDVQYYINGTETTWQELNKLTQTDPDVLTNTARLDEINGKLAVSESFLIVRHDDNIIYSGNPVLTDRIKDRLPSYGSGITVEDAGYYYKDMEKYVKQLDFRFSDGSSGSVFVVSRFSALISQRLLVDMFLAILVILVLTGWGLTRWIHSGVFTPIDQLNKAMQAIKDGNLDYVLETSEEGEIGDLYRNYENMRMQLKETTEESAAKDRKSKELVSNICHDLKTPITAIKGYMEGIMDGVADTPEKMDKYIKTVYNKANDMDRLINELTLYSKVDNNRIIYNFHRINVADYFGDCIEEVGLDLESKNIELNYLNMVAPDTMVIADPEQMKKVINNIISNSVKYMDKNHCKIAIRILDEQDSVMIEIEDNGRGIPAKDLPHIFDRFFRTDASRNSATGGSGIGLSIVKKIIEDHGGYIYATSKEGEGTCMHFVLRKYVELQDK